jgi:hypothetical protein
MTRRLALGPGPAPAPALATDPVLVGQVELSNGVGDIAKELAYLNSTGGFSVTLATGIYGADGGSVSFGGAEITRASPQAIYHAGISRTFQRSRLSLPLSIFPAFWAMDMLGFSLNLVSFLAITLSIGLSDDQNIQINALRLRGAIEERHMPVIVGQRDG